MRFEFATATRIVFGPGTLLQAGALAAELGQRALVVTGRTAARANPLLDDLTARHVNAEMFSVVAEPTIDVVRLGIEIARDAGCDLVIGIGGGSVLDAGKAIAALMTNAGNPLDYLEVIGRGQTLTKLPLPYVAIPTTAGTGSEVTRNAVLAAPEQQAKVSLRSPLMLPRVAVVDPELTLNLPPDITARTGLDALTQLIEPFVSNKANPMTDALCREGIRRAARSLQRAVEHGDDASAREDMSLTSLFGGLALANSGLGAAHGFAGPIGGMFPTPHGAICASLLPYVMSTNVRALRERMPDSEVLKRYREIAQLLTGNDHATIDEGIAWIKTLCEVLHVLPLRSYGITSTDFPALIEKAAVASSMKANPIKLTADEMNEILTRAL